MRSHVLIYILLAAFTAPIASLADPKATLSPEETETVRRNNQRIVEASEDYVGGGKAHKEVAALHANLAANLEARRITQKQHDAMLGDLKNYEKLVTTYIDLLETNNEILNSSERDYREINTVCMKRLPDTELRQMDLKFRERIVYIQSDKYQDELAPAPNAEAAKAAEEARAGRRKAMEYFQRGTSYVRFFRQACSTLRPLVIPDIVKRLESPEASLEGAKHSKGRTLCEAMVANVKQYNPEFSVDDCLRDIYNEDGTDKRKAHPTIGGSRLPQTPTNPASVNKEEKSAKPEPSPTPQRGGPRQRQNPAAIDPPAQPTPAPKKAD